MPQKQVETELLYITTRQTLCLSNIGMVMEAKKVYVGAYFRDGEDGKISSGSWSQKIQYLIQDKAGKRMTGMNSNDLLLNKEIN